MRNFIFAFGLLLVFSSVCNSSFTIHSIDSDGTCVDFPANSCIPCEHNSVTLYVKTFCDVFTCTTPATYQEAGCVEYNPFYYANMNYGSCDYLLTISSPGECVFSYDSQGSTPSPTPSPYNSTSSNGPIFWGIVGFILVIFSILICIVFSIRSTARREEESRQSLLGYQYSSNPNGGTSSNVSSPPAIASNPPYVPQRNQQALPQQPSVNQQFHDPPREQPEILQQGPSQYYNIPSAPPEPTYVSQDSTMEKLFPPEY